MNRSSYPTQNSPLFASDYPAVAPASPHSVPIELIELRARIRLMPAEVRSELEPLVDDACEQAKFRGRALSLAREALEQFRLELTAAQFDLDVTRRERENLRRWSDQAV